MAAAMQWRPLGCSMRASAYALLLLVLRGDAARVVRRTSAFGAPAVGKHLVADLSAPNASSKARAPEQVRANASVPHQTLKAGDERVWKASVEAVLASLPFEAPKKDEGKEKAGRPVSMQVPEDELTEFFRQLSPGCRQRMSATISGRGPAIHTFGTPGLNASEASCATLNGSICFTEAHVAMRKATADGRTVSSAFDVEGDGCLPRECMAGKDLQMLANFMQAKAKDNIAGMGVHVELRVNCTRSGGSECVVGSTPSQSSLSAPPGLRKSAAPGLAVSFAPLLLGAIALALAF